MNVAAWLMCFRLSSPALYPPCPLQYCSLLSAGCSALRLCVCCFLHKCSSLAVRHKDCTVTLLCLAELASLPRTTLLCQSVFSKILMQDNRQDLENRVIVSDLVFAVSLCVSYLSVCWCMSVRETVLVFALISRTWLCAFMLLLLLFLCCVCVCHLLYVIVSRPDSAEGFSSCPSAGSRNGEKDWENDSTTSSTPSNAEYTGI